MTPESEGLLKELRAVCKGHGFRGPSLPDRLGPRLKGIAGINDRDKSEAVRRKLTRWAEFSMSGYTERQVLLLRVVLGLHPEVDRPLDRRYEWLAERLHCGKRTVQRWADEALRQFAYDAVATAGAAAETDEAGHRVTDLEAVLRLDRDPIEVYERRKIEGMRDELTEVVGWFSVPHAAGLDGEFEFPAVRGGEFISVERRPGEFDLIVYRIRLPRPLRRGEVHEYEVWKTFPRGQEVAPLFVVLPFIPYEAFSLRVHFDPKRPPGGLSKLDGVSPWQLKSDQATGEPLSPDGSGRAEVSFHRFHSGRVYGLGWT